MITQDVMVKPTCLESFTLDEFDIQNQVLGLASQRQIEKIIDAGKVAIPKCTLLNLEDLKCFEAVEYQYEQHGVIFNNGIAIQPSNPAFPTHSGLVVLMAAPKSGFLEAKFLRPVSFVSSFVTSSQRLVLSAYNREHKLLTQTILPEPNLANSDSPLPPNIILSVSASDIYRITFCTTDGQFTIDDFSFCH
jgi:hypothetical protein